MAVCRDQVIGICRSVLEALFIALFAFSFTALPVFALEAGIRNGVCAVSIFSVLLLKGFCYNRERLRNILHPAVVFYISYICAQTMQQAAFPWQSYARVYEFTGYILTAFVIFFNFKKARYIDTGIVLFVVYSFRIFDASVSATEFTLVSALALILAFHWLEDMCKPDRVIPELQSFTIPLFAFLGAALLSVIHSVSPYTSFIQTAVLADFIFISFLIAVHIRSSQQIRLVVSALFFVCGILVALVIDEILNRFFIQDINFALSRIFLNIRSGSEIHANSIAGYVSFVLCLIIATAGLYGRLWRRVIAYAAVAVLFVVLVLTYSRLGIASFAVSSLVLFIMMGRRKRGAMPLVIPGIVLLLVAVMVLLPPVRRQINFRVSSLGTAQTLFSCENSLRAVSSSPWLGFGFDNYYVFSKFAGNITPRGFDPVKASMLRDVIMCPSHSLYLGILFGTGVIGFAVFIWFVASIFAYCGVLKKRIFSATYESRAAMGLCAAFLSVLIHGIMAMTFHLTILPAFFWICAGLIVAAGNAAGVNRMVVRRFSAARAAAGASMLVLVSVFFVFIPIASERLLTSAAEDFASSHYGSALASIALAKKGDPLNPKLYELAAEIESAGGNPGRAIDEYRQALARKRDFAFYYKKLGELYKRQKMYPEALASFRAAALLDKWGVCYREHYSDLGGLYQKLGERGQALLQFKAALRMNSLFGPQQR